MVEYLHHISPTIHLTTNQRTGSTTHWHSNPSAIPPRKGSTETSTQQTSNHTAFNTTVCINILVIS